MVRQTRHVTFNGILQILLILLLTGGCATDPVTPALPEATVQPPVPAVAPQARQEWRSEEYVVIIATASDTYPALARTYLGDEKLAYLIAESNNDDIITQGKQLVIPLKPVNPGGIYSNGYQTVPVLCYHQFSIKKTPNKISVSEETFDRQMAYLKNNGYTVISLGQFFDFIEYRRRPPKKSVVITIDDGWKTARTIAYPILRKYGVSATLFVYTDLIKSRSSSTALSWDDINEMVKSGIIEVQSHTATHPDLTKISASQLQKEISEPQRILQSRTGVTASFLAYPYGTFNQDVIETMQKNGLKAGFTVLRGGNAFFQNAWSLNRSMVFNSDKLEDFEKLLDTFHQEAP